MKNITKIANMIPIFISVCIIILSSLALGQDKPPTWVPTPEELSANPWIPNPNQVLIGLKGVSMPIGRILLARKGSEYCALKFTDTWLGETKNDHYTSYEFYYQGDGSGDFSNTNAMSGKGEFFFPRLQSFWGISYTEGRKTTLKCGSMKIEWFYIAYIDYRDIEFAPTPWTSIDEVRVNDSRIQWYKKDRRRERMTLDIDRIWENSQGQ